MNLLKEIQKLKKEFEQNAILRAEWQAIIDGEAFSKICKLVYLEACQASAGNTSLGEHDAMASRRLFKLQAAQEILKALTEAHYPEKKPEALPMEFEHYTADSFTEPQP